VGGGTEQGFRERQRSLPIFGREEPGGYFTGGDEAMYYEEERESWLEAEEERQELQHQLEAERELRKQLESEKAAWEQERARWGRRSIWWTIIAAMLAIGVIACGIGWWITSVGLADTRAEAEHWKSVYDSGGLPVQFSSLHELKDWLAEDNTDIYGGGVEHLSPGALDCDDYALTLQKHALEDGYLISVRFEFENEHACNTAIIGNDVYRIEPQNDTVKQIGCLDK
jgi:hypothetical protein